MTVVVIVAVVVTALVLARLAWRAVWSEKQSIDHHEHAMEVLKDLSSRAGSNSLTGVRGAGEEARPHVYPGSGPRRSVSNASAGRPRAAAAQRTRQGGMTGSVASGGRRLAGQRQDDSRESASAEAPSKRRREAASRPPMVFIADDLAVEAPPGSRTAPSPNEHPVTRRADDGIGAAAASGLAPGAASPVEAASSAEAPLKFDAIPAEDEFGDPGAQRRPVVGAKAADRVMRSLRSLGHSGTYRPRFGLAVGLAVMILAAAAIAGVLVSTRPFSASSQRQLQSVNTPHRHASQPAPVPAPTVQAVSSDALGAQYRAPNGNFTVVLSATGPCWMEVAATPNGQILQEGTLQQGEVRSIPANSVLWLRLGDPKNVSITMNGSTVQLPPSVDGSPYNLNFSSNGSS